MLIRHVAKFCQREGDNQNASLASVMPIFIELYSPPPLQIMALFMDVSSWAFLCDVLNASHRLQNALNFC